MDENANIPAPANDYATEMPSERPTWQFSGRRGTPAALPAESPSGLPPEIQLSLQRIASEREPSGAAPAPTAVPASAPAPLEFPVAQPAPMEPTPEVAPVVDAPVAAPQQVDVTPPMEAAPQVDAAPPLVVPEAPTPVEDVPAADLAAPELAVEVAEAPAEALPVETAPAPARPKRDLSDLSPAQRKALAKARAKKQKARAKAEKKAAATSTPTAQAQATGESKGNGLGRLFGRGKAKTADAPAVVAPVESLVPPVVETPAPIAETAAVAEVAPAAAPELTFPQAMPTAPPPAPPVAAFEPATMPEPTPVADMLPEPVALPEALPATEAVVPEPVATAEPEPASVVESAPVTIAEPAPVAFVEPELIAVVEPEPVAVAEPEPAVERVPEPVAAVEPERSIPQPPARHTRRHSVMRRRQRPASSAVSFDPDTAYEPEASSAPLPYEPLIVTSHKRDLPGEPVRESYRARDYEPPIREPEPEPTAEPVIATQTPASKPVEQLESLHTAVARTTKDLARPSTTRQANELRAREQEIRDRIEAKRKALNEMLDDFATR